MDVSYPSTDLPLGIVEAYRPTIVDARLMRGDMVVMYSDGIVESHSGNNELFGSRRLRSAVRSGRNPRDMLDSIQSALALHVGGAPQNDDLSILVIACEPEGHSVTGAMKEEVTIRQPARDWCFATVLSPPDIRDGDPVSRVVQVIDAAQSLGALRTRLFLILTELYSNALEHGLLRLESRLKHNPENFSEYCLLRARKLDQMDAGRIHLYCSHSATETGGALTIVVHHDGEGFDSSQRLRELPGNEDICGRGIALVRSVCSELTYDDEGRQATAVLHWRAAAA
jgi:anti-sigma regulatory factor (Ser/Thr protein kinase)